MGGRYRSRGPRGAAERTAGDQPEYGGERTGCRGPGGERSRAGRRDGRDGDRGDGEIQSRKAEATRVLIRARTRPLVLDRQ